MRRRRLREADDAAERSRQWQRSEQGDDSDPAGPRHSRWEEHAARAAPAHGTPPMRPPAQWQGVPPPHQGMPQLGGPPQGAPWEQQSAPPQAMDPWEQQRRRGPPADPATEARARDLCTRLESSMEALCQVDSFDTGVAELLVVLAACHGRGTGADGPGPVRGGDSGPLDAAYSEPSVQQSLVGAVCAPPSPRPLARTHCIRCALTLYGPACAARVHAAPARSQVHVVADAR